MLPFLTSITEVIVALSVLHKGKYLFAGVERRKLKEKINKGISVNQRKERKDFIESTPGDKALFSEFNYILKKPSP